MLPAKPWRVRIAIGQKPARVSGTAASECRPDEPLHVLADSHCRPTPTLSLPGRPESEAICPVAGEDDLGSGLHERMAIGFHIVRPPVARNDRQAPAR
jgi:hypothetical protein